MKKIYLIAILLSAVATVGEVSAQAFQRIYEVSPCPEYNDFYGDKVGSPYVNSNGEIMVPGRVLCPYGTPSVPKHAAVLTVASDGDSLSTSLYGVPATVTSIDGRVLVPSNQSGTLVLAGDNKASSGYGSRLLFVKINEQGDSLSGNAVKFHFMNTGTELGTFTAVGDGYVATANTACTGCYENSHFLRLDENFDTLFTAPIAFTSLASVRITAALYDGSHLLLAGYSRADFSGDVNEGLLFKYTPEGTQVWNKVFQINGETVPKSIVKMSNGNYMVAGNTRMQEGSFSVERFFLSEFDTQGDIVWDKIVSFQGSYGNYLNCGLLALSNGNYLLQGSIAASFPDTSTGFTVSYNPMVQAEFTANGSLLWAKSYDLGKYAYIGNGTVRGISYQYGGGAETTDGLLLTGYFGTKETAYQHNKTFIIKTGFDGGAGTPLQEQPVGIAEAAALSSLLRVYPNPVADRLMLELNADVQRTALNVSFFSLTGMKVLETKLEPHNQSVDVSMLVPGIYLLRVEGTAGALRVIKQ